MNPFHEKQLLFSIISPCYGEDYKHLDKVAQHLSEQEYHEFEWLIIFQEPDELHKKGLKEVAKLKKKYSFPITAYVCEEKGAPQARNFGATKANGDVFVFLDSDKYLYPESLRMWSSAFENNSHINRVWGLYDVLQSNGMRVPIGQVPSYPNGNVWYPAFKYTNYCDSTFPIRASAYIEWDETVKSLQDWDWAIRQLKRDDFKGEDWMYIHHSFFACEDVHEGGISEDSHKNWIERTDYVRTKNDLPKSDICVTSLGAPHHGFHVAEKLGADYLPMPSFKPHKYKTIYLVGFYTKEDPSSPYVTQSHLDVFERTTEKTRKIIHWIGTDILQLFWNCNFMKLKELRQRFSDKKIIHLAEVDFTQKELKEIGIDSKVIPIPPGHLYEPIPLPEKFTVGIYETERTDMYNHDFMDTIVRSMPDVQFLFFGDERRKGEKNKNEEHVGYIPTDEIIKRCSLNLRITVHDGYPLLGAEFIMAGRNFITNVPVKGAIVVKKDRKQVVEAIRKARKNPLDPKWSKRMREEMDFKLFNDRIRALK